MNRGVKQGTPEYDQAIGAQLLYNSLVSKYVQEAERALEGTFLTDGQRLAWNAHRDARRDVLAWAAEVTFDLAVDEAVTRVLWDINDRLAARAD